MIAVKLDEDLPHELLDLLKARGIDSVNVYQQGWTGRPDDWILSKIQAESRWLFTADKGFADIRRYAPGTHGGIVCFRADRESRRAYLHLAAFLLDSLDLRLYSGALVIVSFRGVRIVRARAAEMYARSCDSKSAACDAGLLASADWTLPARRGSVMAIQFSASRL